MRTLICPCGKESSPVESGITVGNTALKTNFMPVMNYAGEITWLCGTCYDKAHQLALEIHKIVKDELLYFPNLLKTK